MYVNFPKVFLRVYPYISGRVTSEEGCIAFEGPKVISFQDKEREDTVHYCLYSQIFGAFTGHKYVLNSFCSDEIHSFINGGSSALFFQDERKFYHHTMVGSPGDPGMVPKALSLIFATLADFLPEECEFKLSKNLGKIYRLTEEDRELEKSIRDKTFANKVQVSPEASSSTASSFRPYLYQTLKIDFGKNYLWASSFAIFDNNMYDLLEAFGVNGPRLVPNWRNKIPGEFPLSYLCHNVHVRTKAEALYLFMEAKANFEKSIAENHFDAKRAVFVYCLTNLRHKKEKNYTKVLAHTLGIVSFSGLSKSVPTKAALQTCDYIESILTLMRQLKERPTLEQPEPLTKNNLFECFLRNIWLRNRDISMIINLCITPNKYHKIVGLLKNTCLKQLSVEFFNVKEVAGLKAVKRPKKPKKRLQTENVADEVRLLISLKWKSIQEKAGRDFQHEELDENGVTLGFENPFSVVDFVLDPEQRRRIIFPHLNPWFTRTFGADIEEITRLKLRVLILKHIESVFDGLLQEGKADPAVVQKVCTTVKAQLMGRGKLDQKQKDHVLMLIQRKIDDLVYGPMCFRDLEEVVYIREVVENGFKYI